MVWALEEYTYSVNGEAITVQWWKGTQSNDTVQLEVLAGDQRHSLPAEYREDTGDYTEVFVRAIHRGSGAFLWLSEHSEGIQTPTDNLEAILSGLDGYDGAARQAYTVL